MNTETQILEPLPSQIPELSHSNNPLIQQSNHPTIHQSTNPLIHEFSAPPPPPTCSPTSKLSFPATAVLPFRGSRWPPRTKPKQQLSRFRHRMRLNCFTDELPSR